MGKFFNEVIRGMGKFPINKTTRKTSLEGLRNKFNEEQNTEPLVGTRLLGDNEYNCFKCLKVHRATSKLGKRHLKYKVSNG